ncbi:SDR family oxidoreductase [Rasiella rasia]|uniref:SDR family oxidoreductase n=1 Tax=Rasiella rasia TaxID=2744027 RepID=A0A6G6GQK1_9FLAO|nr:SDR family oxidoreductase [Rasiella rasia]QIE60817.1 SDR family oxidoreductase [Rasiella rasia]
MKNILLIGGSYGIGLEIATQLYKDHNVTVASRTVGNLPKGVRHIPFDVTKHTITNFDIPETIDGLVYNPGSINLKPFKMLSPEAFAKDMNINCIALVRLVHDLLPILKRSKQASLVFFSTVAVQLGMPFHTSISAAKGAVEGFAKALAAEYAPNFRVNVIAPSLTDTPLARTLLGNDDKKEKMGKRHPLKRIGNAADIANVAAFLLSDKSSWITGQVMGIDGGMSTLKL